MIKIKSMSAPIRSGASPCLVCVCLLMGVAPASAYRPFDGTDAAVVDKDKEQDIGEVTAKSAEATAAPAPTPTRVEAMRAKIKAGGHTSPYRFRKILPEPVFGQVKQARGFRQFLLRGLKKVQGEWAMICLTHNILKLHRLCYG